MQLEQGKISGSELTSLVISFVLGSILFLDPGNTAEHQSWMAVIVAMVQALVMAWIYLALFRRFPDKTLVEISELVFGKILGKMMALLFLLYLFHLGSLVMSNYYEFLNVEILVNTPNSVILLALVGLVIYAVFNGIEVIGRCAQGLTVVAVLLILTNVALLLNQYELQNFLPFFTIPVGQLLWAAQEVVAFPFGETVVFMMILPWLNQPKETGKSFIKGLIYGGILLVLLTFRNTGVLGGLKQIVTFPGLYVGRLLNVGGVLTRLEIIIIVNYLLQAFVKIIIVLYGVSLGMAQLCSFESYQRIILPLALLMGIVALNNFNNVAENLELINRAYPVYYFFFQLIIPLVTLVVALIRKLPRDTA